MTVETISSVRLGCPSITRFDYLRLTVSRGMNRLTRKHRYYCEYRVEICRFFVFFNQNEANNKLRFLLFWNLWKLLILKIFQITSSYNFIDFSNLLKTFWLIWYHDNPTKVFKIIWNLVKSENFFSYIFSIFLSQWISCVFFDVLKKKLCCLTKSLNSLEITWNVETMRTIDKYEVKFCHNFIFHQCVAER